MMEHDFPMNGVATFPPQTMEEQNMQPMQLPYQHPQPQEPQPTMDDVYAKHFENILPILSSEDIEYINTKIWPTVKRANEANQNVKHIFSDIIPLLASTIPNKMMNMGKANGGDDPIRNSGSMFLYSQAFLETLVNIAQTVLTFIVVGDKKFDTVIGSHIQNMPGMDEVGKRVREWCQSYFTEGLLPGYKQELLISIIWGVLSGDGVRKIFHDPNRGMPRAGLIMPGDYFFTSELKNFYDLKGFVHKFRIDHDMMMQKVDSGEWTRAFSTTADEDDDGTQELREGIGKTLGHDSDAFMDEAQDFQRVYNGFEYNNVHDLKSDPERNEEKWGGLPYLFVFGEGGVCTQVKRQWYPEDTLRFTINDYVHYRFLPGLDENSYGLAHVAGQRARAATVLQRQLVDAAQLANVSTGFFKPTGRITDRTFDLKSGQFFGLGAGEDDIRKTIYTIPYNPPNPVIMQLMQSLEDDIRKFSHIVTTEMVNLATQAPAATLLAVLKRMEQLPNSILQGMYDSFSEELRIFKRKFYEWLPPQEMFSIDWQGKKLTICREDFSPGVEIIPTGQFSMESEAYKMMRAQLILNQATQLPQFHNIPSVLTQLYKDAGLTPDDIKSIVVDPNAQQPPPPSLEPTSENTNLMTGKPVQAYPGQDHEAHEIVHQLPMQNEDPQIQAATKAHIQHHRALALVEKLQAVSGVQLPPDTSQLPLEQQNMIAVEMAKAAIQLQQMQQQQNPQPQPIDPGLVALEEVKVQRENAQIDAEVQMKRIEMEREKSENKKEVDVLNIQKQLEENRRENLRLQSDMQETQFNMLLRIHELELHQKDHHIKRLDGEIRNLKSISDMEHDLLDKVEEENNEDEEHIAT